MTEQHEPRTGQLPDGWYLITNKKDMSMAYRVVDNAIPTNVGTIGIDVYRDAGCVIEPVEVCDKESLAKMRRDLAAMEAERDEWRKRNADCTTSLITADRQLEQLRAELAALRAEARYVPAESGEVYFDFYIGTTADRRVRIRKTDELGKITNDFVTLPDKWNVCRLVPGQDGQQGEGQ